MIRFFALFLLSFAACMDDDDFLATPLPEMKPTLQLNYLALGDSYTIGTSVEEDERWPAQLAQALAPDSVQVNRLDYVATNGWTTSELIGGITNNRQRLLEEYDMVSLLIGVNNQYRGQPVSGYEQEFTTLLETAIAFAGGDSSRVFVVSIPDYAYTPFGGGRAEISEALLRFNATANFIADDYKVPFYNITPISQEALADPGLVASDNLHPSGKQYRRWVQEVIKPEVLQLLNR